MQDNLVSIIVPMYNSDKYLRECLDSIKAQNYINWECIIIDDCSNDKSFAIATEYAKEDDRFIIIQNAVNSGTAVSRNKGVEKASGRFIAFLDSDDVWKSSKLSKQIQYMLKYDYSFTSTYYQIIDDVSNKKNQIKKFDLTSNYKKVLKKPPGNSTVIYDTKKIDKVFIPNIRKRNDYIMWLTIIKKAKNLNCLPEILAYYRVRKNSLSSKKIQLIKYNWRVYRKYENLNFFYSMYLIIVFGLRGIIRKLRGIMK